MSVSQATLDRMHSLGVRGIQCAGCEKQRHAPRVPEALLGWVKRKSDGAWFCPDCKKHKGCGDE